MNILLAYPKEKGTTAEYCEKALRKMHHVETFDLLETPNYMVKFGKLICKGLPIKASSIIKKCEKKPDILIEIDGNGMHHLKGLKEIDIPSIFWSIDSHIEFKQKFHKKIINDFNQIYVAQKKCVALFEEEKSNVYWLPVAADPEIHKKYSFEKIYDIGFVGNLNRERHPGRVEVLEMLSKKFKVKAEENIFGIEMAKIYNKSKMGFNKSIAGDLNMRVFEVLSCGTFLLTDRIDNGLEDIFIDKKHLVQYDMDSMEELISYYLENDKERNKIAEAGHNEVLEKHTYEIRMDTMLKPFN